MESTLSTQSILNSPNQPKSLAEQAGQFKSQLPVKRAGGRAADQPRPLLLETGYNMHAEGSVLVSSGSTKVICTASVEERVPIFRRGTGGGWLTAEYGMLPRATGSRGQREATAGRPGGRTAEIQRLIGRSLRAVVDLKRLGERTIWVDCDVVQADGGTRTAVITGGFVALVLALRHLNERKKLKASPLLGSVAAVSAGVVDGQAMLDLDYQEDSNAEVDLNVVMNGELDLIEIQGTAEGQAFSRAVIDAMLDLAEKGVRHHTAAQVAALGGRLL